MSRRSIRLGVTGGIGSGKSTVAAILGQCGAAVVDADGIARTVTEAGGAAIPALRAAFGPEYITGQGALDRARMRALAFADPQAKQRLEAIVHPLVGRAIAKAVQEVHQSGPRLIVLDIPLLTESPRWPRQLDAVLVVDCLEETQIARVRARSGLDGEAVRDIMAAQSTRAVRRAAADIVLYNEGVTLPELHTKVYRIAASFGL